MANTNEAESRSTHVIHEKDQVGQVIIADEVVASIASVAATEVEGVESMADHISRELIAKLGRNSKGVRVDVGEDEVTVYLSLNISYGYNIPETAAKVQESVKKAIENMIGFSVKNVHIKISGVVVSK
ncbi:MAG: Asp23/Gls24 family envelope stress response protein [Lachnospiraceae bacterium]|nr:Asp23/Gls24 family envelope stress response protein [Lachnospiraceae bacterium]